MPPPGPRLLTPQMGESDDERKQNHRLSVIYSEPPEDQESASYHDRDTFIGDTDAEAKTKTLDDKTIPRVKLGFPAKYREASEPF